MPRITIENDDSIRETCCFPSAGRVDAGSPWEPTKPHSTQPPLNFLSQHQFILPSSSSTRPDCTLRGDLGSRFVLVVLYLLSLLGGGMSLLFTGLGSHREDTTVRFLYRVFGRWRISARESISLGGVSVLVCRHHSCSVKYGEVGRCRC